MTTSAAPLLDSVGRRVAFHRSIAGLTQKELADRVGLSPSAIQKIEQGELTPRLQLLHRIAQVLRVTTATLAGDSGDREPAHADTVQLWTPVRDALVGKHPPADDQPATVAGVTAVYNDAQQAFRRSRYGDVLTLLPRLIGDAVSLGADGRAVRCDVLGMVGWLLTHTHQYDQAKMALTSALDDAVDRRGTAAVVHVLTWLDIRSGHLDGCHRTAVEWADRLEPRPSRATVDEWASWGWLLIRVATSAVRDNRPGAANDALRLAKMAAAIVGREVFADGDPRRPFGPAVVTAKEAELEMIAGRPDRVLALASTIAPELLLPASPNWCRHRLDVANALAHLGRVDEALDQFDILRRDAPQWLTEQRYGRDVFLVALGTKRRRKLPERMRNIAHAIRWSDN